MIGPAGLALRTALHYWRTNLAVTGGVAAAVAVLAGALVVGASIRESLRDLALGRLGRTEHAVTSTGFFRDALAGELDRAGVRAAPLITAGGTATLERSGRRASGIQVYGVDERFWTFHGRQPPAGAAVSPALAAELDARAGDTLLVRMQKPSAIPVESLFGRRDDVGRTVRIDVAQALTAGDLGEFSLQPQQGDVRAVFAPLRRVQRDLDVRGVNTVLVGGSDGRAIAAEAVERQVAALASLEDLGVSVTAAPDRSALIVESAAGILGGPVESAARQAALDLGLAAQPVLTYLATTISRGGRQIPYSLVTAIDLDAAAPGRRPPSGWTDDSIVLNTWAAGELGASPGDAVEIEYLLWDPAAGLTRASAAFRLDAVVPIGGLAGDRRLTPPYPGVTEAASLADWDPPFPVDLARIRPRDEAYWQQYRTTPKGFITTARGRTLWRSRYGSATSLRIAVPAGAGAEALLARLQAALRQRLAPSAAGFAVLPVRQRALEASRGSTDFGEYFTYFSAFIVVSAVMLAGLFFRLGIEQRLRQVGILRAAGFQVRAVRRLLLLEALVPAAAGSLLGAAGAVAYAALIVHALRTWWIGAVGTSRLSVHVEASALAAGAAIGMTASLLALALSLRQVSRLSPRALLSAETLEAAAGHGRRARRALRLAGFFGLTGALLAAAGFAYRDAQAGLFFGAGAALLAAAMSGWASWLRGSARRPLSGRGAWPIWRLGLRGAAFRPSRSVLSAALVASAAFIIVSVDAFRKGAPAAGDTRSGTGGFAWVGQSELPVVSNPADAAGWDALGLGRRPEGASAARFTRFRLRRGEDASCLNLYRPASPTIVAPEPAFLEAGRFSFAASLAETADEKRNPWLLLRRPATEAIPVVADATSLQYVLHASLGDTFALDVGTGAPVRLQFVAALSDSVLQSELVMSEENFLRIFPAEQGYRFFLIDEVRPASPGGPALGEVLEREMAAYGMDLVAAGDRLESFHRVENTYLSTFQALGGLGLVLGSVGLGAIMFRNALERRREIAMLRAVGFGTRAIGLMVVAEASLLLAVGLASGAGAAAVAVAPAWYARGGGVPGAGLVLLAAVGTAGLVSSLLAARAAAGGSMLGALRSE